MRISAKIPKELWELLNTISKLEGKPKSYYIRKGLELILVEKPK